MNRYSVRGVMPRRFAASAVESQWISALIGGTLHHLCMIFDISDFSSDRAGNRSFGENHLGVALGATVRGESVGMPASNGVGRTTNVVARRRSLPSGRAV